MAKIKIDLEFPCGYKYRLELESYVREMEYPAHDTFCPMHGKNCKRLN